MSSLAEHPFRGAIALESRELKLQEEHELLTSGWWNGKDDKREAVRRKGKRV